MALTFKPNYKSGAEEAQKVGPGGCRGSLSCGFPRGLTMALGEEMKEAQLWGQTGLGFNPVSAADLLGSPEPVLSPASASAS